MTKNKLYTLTLIACFFGYSWLLFFDFISHSHSDYDFTVCVFKRITTIPCPSCGTSRAVNSFFKGNILTSLYLNPFGIIVAGIMLIAPGWIAFDYFTKRQSFYDFYIKTEKIIRTKKVAILLVILVIINWIWNINKQI
ncbi:DUF2752 domain-containing protein [Flavobacterium sp. ALJ2]|uniref:DUF2752 domain-containing protein n=1 Tax=Flavobacterium sp. ALJ2 TaxID=2786960 RepID=UPI00189CCC50|nr:DUF2752 domain-containing protein [Flavobacterium sp. ALJ2]MBF7093378.1 DUF2752 domain-containing protein [Flavobacterium sp. ALJ2]